MLHPEELPQLPNATEPHLFPGREKLSVGTSHTQRFYQVLPSKRPWTQRILHKTLISGPTVETQRIPKQRSQNMPGLPNAR